MEPGLLEAPLKGAGSTFGDLPVDEQGEAVLEGHVGEIPPCDLLEEGGAHPGKAQLGEAIGQGV